jgi:hypothetical protein
VKTPRLPTCCKRLLGAISIALGTGLAAYGFIADREHQVKAAFIFNFAKFCDWNIPGGASAPFMVGALRTDAYGSALEILNGKSANGHVISVARVASDSDLSRYQIVVVGNAGPEEVTHLVRTLRNSGTLLIGESEGFARLGGTIGFVIKDGTVRFDINQESAKADNVKLSSKLLRLAGQVY